MRNRGSLYAGLLVILLGIIMFLAQATRGGALFGMRLGWRAAWPFFILWAGAAFLLPLVVWWERRASLAGPRRQRAGKAVWGCAAPRTR